MGGIVTVSWELLVVDRKKMDGFSEATGPVGDTIEVTLSVDWNPFRLWKLRVIVAFDPGEMVRMLEGLDKLKSVTMIVSWTVRLSVPSVADTMIV